MTFIPFISDSQIIKPPTTGIVIFGATGDLCQKKLLPALWNLYKNNYLPLQFFILGASRTKHSDESFRELAKKQIKKSDHNFSETKWAEFIKNLYYQPFDASQKKHFDILKTKLSSMTKEDIKFNYLFYLATSPSIFDKIVKGLGECNLLKRKDGISRIVVEKPFGFDLASACKLNNIFSAYASEDQIYRIDHYLGKETVQNILVLRFTNGIFEPLWNRNYVDHIQISVCESIGIENRGSYFDTTGIVRDIIQNHLLQMLALFCIEPPYSATIADAIRDEKVKVIRSLKRLDYQRLKNICVMGQYDRGYILGKQVKGYLEEKNVSADSTTETFAALLIEIDNWRWEGVPILIRTGKRLPKKITDITMFFKTPPSTIFGEKLPLNIKMNSLTINVQPTEGISFLINSKAPGPSMKLRSVDLDFLYKESFMSPSPDAYERLILDALKGDLTLFTRSDEIEACWEFLSPLLNALDNKELPIYKYNAGTWGPVEAEHLAERIGREWKGL